MSDQEKWRRSPAVGPANPGSEMDAEIGFHLEEIVNQLRREGLDPEAARAEALRRFGRLSEIRRATGAVDRSAGHRARWIDRIRDGLGDIRFAGRLLRRNPGFTLLAAGCIGLGVAVTSAILSAGYSILIRPLPYPEANQLVSVYGRAEKRGFRGSNISYPDYVSWRDQNGTLVKLGMWTWTSLSLTDGTGEAERVEAASVTGEVLPLIGVSPRLGRLIGPEDAVRGAPRVIVLGQGLWNRRYGADTAIIGRPIMVNGEPTVVVGVMPPKFAFPDGQQAWIPFRPDPDEGRGNRGYAGAIGRLKPGVTPASAQSDLDRISIALEREFPNVNLDWRSDVVAIRDDLVGSLRRPLEVFLAAVVCLLLIVTANVASLLLARGFERRREMAVRTAIGAGRGRLLRQLLVESLTLSFVGGLLGVGGAAVGIRMLGLTFPDGVPAFLTLELDWVSIGFTLIVTVVTGILAGLWPAIRTAGPDLTATFRDGGLGGSGSTKTGRLRGGLVVTEFALSVLLLIAGGLLLKSFASLSSTDLGFDRNGLVTARLALPRASYPEPAQRIAFFQSLLERLEATPGIEAVGSAQGAPMSGWNVQSSMVIEGKAARSADNQLVVHYQMVSPGFFKALGVPILSGRNLTDADSDTLRLTGVINDILAKQEFGDEDPIGKRIRWGQSQVVDTAPQWITIVGVVKSFRHYRLPDRMGPAIYLAYPTYPSNQQELLVRTNASDPLSLIPAIRAAVRELDPKVPLYRVGTFDQTLARVLWQQRLQGQVIGVFAAFALILATVGIYGVVSYNVRQRTRELGIRAAVGASTGDLSRLVVREGSKLSLIGIGIGFVAAIAFTRLLRTLLYGVAPIDPVVFLAAPLTLLAVAIGASWIPARRAGRADPLVAIRSD